MKALFIAFVVFVLCNNTLGGVFRHDVPVEKYLELAKQTQFGCVGQLKKVDGGGAGSAVMIASNWAVTSAHIFDASMGKGMTLEINGQTFQILEAILHPDFQKVKTAQYTDLALVKLLGNYKGEIARIYNKGKEIKSIATMVGYGRSRGAFEPSAKLLGKMAGQNVIDAIGGKDLPDNFLSVDFDSPAHVSLSSLGDAKPLPLEYIIDGGDSGGGLFVEHDGKWFLAGINTRTVHDQNRLTSNFEKYGFYGSVSHFTRITSYQEWIKVSTGKAN